MSKTDSGSAHPPLSKRILIDLTLTGDEIIADFILAISKAAAAAGQDRIQFCVLFDDAEGH